MGRARMSAWCVILSVTVVLCGGMTCDGEVTVVGSLWHERPPCLQEDMGPYTETPVFSPTVSGQFDAIAPPEIASSADSCPSDIPPEASEAVACKPRLFTFAQRPLQVDWYARFDYFFWKEQANNADLLNEHGVLYTLGYVRTNRAKRLRVELFTGTMQYIGGTWGGYDVTSTTRYLGARGEFELIWDVSGCGWPPVSLFAGIGNRFWIRDIKDGVIEGLLDAYSIGYQENWWTLYPYLGFEKKWIGRDCNELFFSGRIGATAYTYEYPSMAGSPSLYPQPSLTGQMELGLRHEHFLVSAYFEAMTWTESPVVRGVYQPGSQMFTTGLKLGLSF